MFSSTDSTSTVWYLLERADRAFFDLNFTRIIVHSPRDREQQNEEYCDREDFATPFENFLPTHDASEF